MHSLKNKPIKHQSKQNLPAYLGCQIFQELKQNLPGVDLFACITNLYETMYTALILPVINCFLPSSSHTHLPTVKSYQSPTVIKL